MLLVLAVLDTKQHVQHRSNNSGFDFCLLLFDGSWQRLVCVRQCYFSSKEVKDNKAKSDYCSRVRIERR